MDACCKLKSAEIENLKIRYKRVLLIVLVINGVLFVLEAIAGLLAIPISTVPLGRVDGFDS